MSVGSRKDVQALLAAGRVVTEALARMRALVRPGATTAELDRAAAEVFGRHGARSAPQLAYDFPGVTCISVNDEAVHGIPGTRRIAAGDLVKLDVTAELRGYMADAAVTVAVPPVAPEDADLVAAAEAGLAAGIAVARAGSTTGAVGAAVEAEVERRGFRVLRELAGHGIGRAIHAPPSVPWRVAGGPMGFIGTSSYLPFASNWPGASVGAGGGVYSLARCSSPRTTNMRASALVSTRPWSKP